MPIRPGRTNAYRAVMRELRAMGLPDTLWDADFEAKEAQAREREIELFRVLEAESAADPDDLKLANDVDLWRETLANPMHYASLGETPQWIRELQDACTESRFTKTGGRAKAMQKYMRKWRAQRKEREK